MYKRKRVKIDGKLLREVYQEYILEYYKSNFGILMAMDHLEEILLSSIRTHIPGFA